MSDPNAFTACSRCNKNPAPQPMKVHATAEGVVVTEVVQLCTPCRIKADRENAAASNRSRGDHT